MQKKFIKQLVFLFIINISIKPVWLFVIDRSVQNVVGPEDYGIYFALFNFSYILQMILDMGISNFNIKNIAQHEQLLSKYFPNIIIVKFLLSFVYIGLIFLAALLLQYDDFMLRLLGVIAFNQVLASIILFLRSNLAGLQLFRLNSIFSVLDRGLLIIICSVLLWGNVTQTPFKIEWFIYSQTAALAITSVIAFFLVLSRTTHFKINWNYPFILLILRQSWPFALFGILTMMHTRLDVIILERIVPEGLGARQAGIYASCYRILDASNMISFLFATLLLPMFARMISKKEAVGPLAKICFNILIIPGIVFTMALSFHRVEIMNSLYKYAVDDYYNAFGILIFTFIPIAASYIYGTLLTANGNLKALIIIAGSGVILNIILNFILIVRFQATGAAIATLVTQYLVVAAQMIVAKNIFSFKIPLRLIASFITFLIITVAINYIMQEYFDNWKLNISIAILISAFAGFILKLIDIKAILKLLKPEQI